MATERGGEEAPACRTTQQQNSKAEKMAGEHFLKVREAAMLSFFWAFVRKLETRIREGDQAGLYKHLKTINLEVERGRSSAYIKHEDGILLRDVERIGEQWVPRFYTLTNAKSPKPDLNMAEGLGQRPENMPLGVQPTMQELADIIHSLANGKDVGLDGVSIVQLKITPNGDPALRRRLLDIVVCI